MLKLISALCVGLSLVMAVPPAIHAASKGEACRRAVEEMRSMMVQENGVAVSGVESFQPTDLGYGPRDRPLGYTISLAADSDAVNFLNSPVTMASYAQQIAEGCRSVAMVTFWIDDEGGWGETFGLDGDGKMFQFKCIGSGSSEARQEPLPWGLVICG